MTSKFQLPLVEFYITNVCNLTCRGCNRFNNYNFKGHQRWANHADQIEQWSHRLDLTRIDIIGGEPTLNPDLELWASNLRRFWPNSDIMIQTNGTYFRPEYRTFWKRYRVSFGVALHDLTTAEELKRTWENQGVFDAFVFHQSAVIKQDDHFVLHHSDAELAFRACGMRHDHTMFNGKLYKCPAMSGLPEFKKQFDLRLDQRRTDLLNAYQPLSANCTQEELAQFISLRDTAIPQCEFCPQVKRWTTALGPEITNLPEPNFNQKS